VSEDLLKQVLRSRYYFNLPAVFHADTLSVPQQPADLDDERGLLAVVQPQQQAALAAGIEIKDGAKRHDEVPLK
jgi:hypothetical protein